MNPGASTYSTGSDGDGNNSSVGNLPNFGTSAPNPVRITQSLRFDPASGSGVRANNHTQQLGQSLQINPNTANRSSLSPLHINLSAAQEQQALRQSANLAASQSQQHNNNNNNNNNNPLGQSGQQQSQQLQQSMAMSSTTKKESPKTPPRKNLPITSSSSSAANVFTSGQITTNKQHRGYTPTTAGSKQGAVTQLRDVSPYSREQIQSYNKALDSVALLGNEFEQTIRAFQTAHEQLLAERERTAELTDMYESQLQAEREAKEAAIAQAEAAAQEANRVSSLLEGANQQLEFNVAKIKTLERKCGDLSVVEQKLQSLKVISSQQEIAVKERDSQIEDLSHRLDEKEQSIHELEMYKSNYNDISQQLDDMKQANEILQSSANLNDKLEQEHQAQLQALHAHNQQLADELQAANALIGQFIQQCNLVHDEFQHGGSARDTFSGMSSVRASSVRPQQVGSSSHQQQHTYHQQQQQQQQFIQPNSRQLSSMAVALASSDIEDSVGSSREQQFVSESGVAGSTGPRQLQSNSAQFQQADSMFSRKINASSAAAGNVQSSQQQQYQSVQGSNASAGGDSNIHQQSSQQQKASSHVSQSSHASTKQQQQYCGVAALSTNNPTVAKQMSVSERITSPTGFEPVIRMTQTTVNQHVHGSNIPSSQNAVAPTGVSNSTATVPQNNSIKERVIYESVLEQSDRQQESQLQNSNSGNIIRKVNQDQSALHQSSEIVQNPGMGLGSAIQNNNNNNSGYSQSQNQVIYLGNNRTVAFGENNLVDKVRELKLKYSLQTNVIESIEKQLQDHIEQIHAIEDENSRLNLQHNANRQEIAQLQKELQDAFEFHKHSVEVLRKEFDSAIVPLIEEKHSLVELNQSLSKQCEAFDQALVQSTEDKDKAIKELISEQEQIQDFSAQVMKEKEAFRQENIALKEENSRKAREANQILRDSEDKSNEIVSLNKDIEAWKAKYKNLKREINGLRAQFDAYKLQVIADIQAQILDHSAGFSGVLNGLKSKYYEQGDSVMQSARDAIIHEDIQRTNEFPFARQATQNNNNNHHHFAHNKAEVAIPQGSTHQSVRTTDFIGGSSVVSNNNHHHNQSNSSGVDNEENADEMLGSSFVPKQQQNAHMMNSSASSSSKVSAGKRRADVDDDNEISIDTLQILKHQYEQSLDRVNSSISPDKQRR